MSKEVKSIEEALELLKAWNVRWVRVNRIENSLFETGVAFFSTAHCRVAYYDEVHNLLALN